MSRPVVLTIAGHDPSGGAGVTADLRVIDAIGCEGVSAVTALTVQNTLGVQSMHLTEASILKAQLDALFSDIPISTVKIGMLGGVEQVRAVAGAIRRHCPQYVVLDPVFASSSGLSLLDDAGIRALVTDLIPLCTIITPNLAEAVRLTGMPVVDPETMEAAGRRLVSMGARAALVKGGHLKGDPIDVLVDDSGPSRRIESSRIGPVDAHGTGCFLSAAIAARYALDRCGYGSNRRGASGDEPTATDAFAAVKRARSVLRMALGSPVTVGGGPGYPNALAATRRFAEGGSAAARMECLRGIYAITGLATRPDRTARSIIEAALEGGCTVAQYRNKAAVDTDQMVHEARRLVRIAHQHGAIVIVNDRVDVAMASGADGVHLGPGDMTPADAWRTIDPNLLIGASVATLDEAQAAAPYASYFGVGAVFGSTTKTDAGEPIGVDRVRAIKAAYPQIPIVAIGGINADNIVQVRDTGAEAAAVISAIVGADDMVVATRELVGIWNDRVQSDACSPRIKMRG